MVNYKVKGFGWRKDRVDKRDYTPLHPEIQQVAKASGCDCGSIIAKAPGMNAPFPTIKDNRKFCSTINDQGDLGSCTANAYTSMYEFLNKRHKKKYEKLSRLFIYKLTRKLMGEEGIGDSGAYLRTTLQAGSLFGTCPESWLPYDITAFDEEPQASTYAYSQNYQATKYLRLDRGPGNNVDRLQIIKTFINAEYPVICGFNVYSSYTQSFTNGGVFPYPTPQEDIVGGHAILLVGFDEEKTITNENDGSQCKGAFIIQNSWGYDWGELGFGYLPYRYLHEGVADDFWTITRAEFVDTGQFQ
jgi:C1A family cysteine protease